MIVAARVAVTGMFVMRMMKICVGMLHIQMRRSGIMITSAMMVVTDEDGDFCMSGMIVSGGVIMAGSGGDGARPHRKRRAPRICETPALDPQEPDADQHDK